MLNGSSKRHQLIVKAIIAEQARHIRTWGVTDVEILGQFAHDAASHRQRLAEIRGMQDEMEASDDSSSRSAWSLASSSSCSGIASPTLTSSKSVAIDQKGQQGASGRRAARRRARVERKRPTRTGSRRSLKHS